MKAVRYTNIPYKHRLKDRATLQTSIFGYDIKLDFIRLYLNGLMELEPEYMWDGASGPTWDTPNVKVPSAGHDATFQLMRLGLIPRCTYFKISNEDMYRWLRERNMNLIRAAAWKKGLDLFGKKHTHPKEVKYITVW